MKINVTKPTHHYAAGEHEVSEERGNYLIKMGIAVMKPEPPPDRSFRQSEVSEKPKEDYGEKMIEPQIENKLSPIKPKNKRKKK